jgi:hypothetical protein
MCVCDRSCAHPMVWEAAEAATEQCRRYGVQQMSVEKLREVLDDDDLRDTVQLLDVREAWEAEESSLPHFTLLPLSRWVVMHGNKPALPAPETLGATDQNHG